MQLARESSTDGLALLAGDLIANVTEWGVGIEPQLG